MNITIEPQVLGGEMGYLMQIDGEENMHVRAVAPFMDETGNEPRPAARIILRPEGGKGIIELELINYKGALFMRASSP